MHIVIIGGGIIGLSSAYYLRKAGMEVTVVEQSDLNDGCSFGNMGYISPSHFIPLATPGIIAQGMKWMMSSSSPFYIKPRLDMDLMRWGMQFYKSASHKKLEENAPHLNNLLQLSKSLMVDLHKELEQPFAFVQRGCWMLYKSEKTGEHEKQLSEQAHSYGLKTLICNRQEVQDREPEVAVQVAGGVLYIDDSHVQPRELMRALYHQLQQMQVHFMLQQKVTGFETANGKIKTIKTTKQVIAADEVLVANGSWMGTVGKLLGLHIPMQPGKGYSFEYNNLQANLQAPSILVEDRVATSPVNNWLRIGGTMELSGHSNNILPRRVTAIYEAFKKYYPTMALQAPDPAKAWYGYRPVSPDGMPYIGRGGKYKNLSFAGGHAMLGVSAAAGTGLLMSEIIQNRETAIAITHFNPGRFL